MPVEFVDLGRQHAVLKDELLAAVRSSIERSAFIGGRDVADFEQELASFMETRLAVGTASCTASLAMTLRALGLAAEDEVITTPLTAMPTAEAIRLAGARPCFADIEADTFQLDPKAVEAAITPRTRALIVVHLYGLCARVEELAVVARANGIELIEDVAQAQGARLGGRRVGTFGRAGCLSFFPSKNLGAFGDAGAVTSDDEQLIRFVRMYSNHGRTDKYIHEMDGANERLDALQASILRVKLTRLEEWNQLRRQAAWWYGEELGDVSELRLPAPIPGSTPVWHLYVVQTPRRAALAQFLGKRGIGSGLHYPVPLHLQPAFASSEHAKGAFPTAEQAADEVLSLPMHPYLTRDEVARVGAAVRDFFRGAS